MATIAQYTKGLTTIKKEVERKFHNRPVVSNNTILEIRALVRRRLKEMELDALVQFDVVIVDDRDGEPALTIKFKAKGNRD